MNFHKRIIVVNNGCQDRLKNRVLLFVGMGTGELAISLCTEINPLLVLWWAQQITIESCVK